LVKSNATKPYVETFHGTSLLGTSLYNLKSQVFIIKNLHCVTIFNISGRSDWLEPTIRKIRLLAVKSHQEQI
jgi:hypothetical protein